MHTVVASAVLFLTAVLRRFRRAGSRDERLGVLRVVGSATAAGLVAVGLSAPNLFPFLEALPQTLDFQVRHNLYTKATKSLPLADVLGSAVAAVFPGLYGPVWWDPGVVHPPRFDDATGAFIGGLALGLALLGSTSRRPEARPFAILGFVAFVVALGSPGFADALAWFPLFDSAFNQRLSGVSVLCLAALSAFGLELALEDFRGRRSFFFLALGAVLLGAGLILRTRVAHTSHARRFDWEIAFLVLPLLLWAAAARLRHLEWRFPRPSRPFLASLATALFLLPQLGTFPRLYRTFREALVYPEVEELRALPRGGEPFRTFGLGGTLLPMTSVFYGLQDPRRIPVMSNARLLETYPLFADASSWFQRIDDANAPFLAFLNARFAIAPPDAKTPSQWAEVLRGNNCAVLFNPRALPRAFAPKRIRFSGDRARTIAEMKAQDDFEALAWLEPVAIEGGARAGTAYEEQNGPASVTTTAVGDNFLLDIDAAAPSWIVVSQTAWRGWNAMEGRVRYPLYFANNAFLAFKVEGGRHRIALVYCPASFPWGLACAAITLIGLVTVIAISARRLQAEERLTRA